MWKCLLNLILGIFLSVMFVEAADAPATGLLQVPRRDRIVNPPNQAPAIRQVYAAKHLTGPPELDGRVAGDPVWTEVPTDDNFLELGSKDPAGKRTQMQIGYDRENLYIGLIAFEPEMDKIKARCQDNEAVWSEDSIEIFIFPAESNDYFQLVFNVAGARLNLRNTEIQPLREWEVKTFQDHDFYSAEVQIPFAILGGTPKENTSWLFNIGRNSYVSALGRFSTWAPLSKGFHDPENFAMLLFDAAGNEDCSHSEEAQLKRQWEELANFVRYWQTSEPALKEKIDSYMRDCGWNSLEEEVRNAESLTAKDRQILNTHLRKLAFRLPAVITGLRAASVADMKNSFFD